MVSLIGRRKKFEEEILVSFYNNSMCRDGEDKDEGGLD